MAARSVAVAPALARMGERRLRMKTARIAPLVADAGPGQALHTLMLETLAGRTNRAAFASLARALPLAVLVEEADSRSQGDRALVLAALLKGAASRIALRRAGLRPLASPAARLEAMGRLAARLWPAGPPGWPTTLTSALPAASLLRGLQVAGIGRETAIELAVNAVLPAGLAAGVWSGDAAARTLAALPAPGTYGKLRRLEGWLDHPFTSASALQGGLLLHGDYCTKGMCGRCPVSGGR
jgi:hypothetical protein